MRCGNGHSLENESGAGSVAKCGQMCDANSKCTHFAYWSGKKSTGHCELCDAAPTKDTNVEGGWTTDTYEMGCGSTSNYCY